jgi:hypothetical protein
MITTITKRLRHGRGIYGKTHTACLRRSSLRQAVAPAARKGRALPTATVTPRHRQPACAPSELHDTRVPLSVRHGCSCTPRDSREAVRGGTKVLFVARQVHQGDDLYGQRATKCESALLGTLTHWLSPACSNARSPRAAERHSAPLAFQAAVQCEALSAAPMSHLAGLCDVLLARLRPAHAARARESSWQGAPAPRPPSKAVRACLPLPKLSSQPRPPYSPPEHCVVEDAAAAVQAQRVLPDGRRPPRGLLVVVLEHLAARSTQYTRQQKHTIQYNMHMQYTLTRPRHECRAAMPRNPAAARRCRPAGVGGAGNTRARTLTLPLVCGEAALLAPSRAHARVQ